MATEVQGICSNTESLSRRHTRQQDLARALIAQSRFAAADDVNYLTRHMLAFASVCGLERRPAGRLTDQPYAWHAIRNEPRTSLPRHKAPKPFKGDYDFAPKPDENGYVSEAPEQPREKAG
jgi:hypothetical protein